MDKTFAELRDKQNQLVNEKRRLQDQAYFDLVAPYIPQLEAELVELEAVDFDTIERLSKRGLSEFPPPEPHDRNYVQDALRSFRALCETGLRARRNISLCRTLIERMKTGEHLGDWAREAVARCDIRDAKSILGSAASLREFAERLKQARKDVKAAICTAIASTDREHGLPPAGAGYRKQHSDVLDFGPYEIETSLKYHQ